MPPKRHQHDFQRARSDTQKGERRRDILDAALAHLTAVGFEAFSMGALAKGAGVARGTLYLYFHTREEVLLALYLEEARAWLDELESITEPDMSTEDYLRAVFTSATRRTAFMDLAPRVTGVLENNVSIERLAESKRLAAVPVEVAGRRTGLALGRPPEQGAALATALFALMVGVTQTMQAPRTLQLEHLPQDVRILMEGESPEDAFLRIGSWLVAGSR